jgi:hypothetical protein
MLMSISADVGALLHIIPRIQLHDAMQRPIGHRVRPDLMAIHMRMGQLARTALHVFMAPRLCRHPRLALSLRLRHEQSISSRPLMRHHRQPLAPCEFRILVRAKHRRVSNGGAVIGIEGLMSMSM